MTAETPVIVVGAGGHALVLLDALLLLKVVVLGLVDLNAESAGRLLLGHRVIGSEELLEAHVPGTIRLVNAIGSTGSMERRRLVFERLRAAGHAFAGVAHPSAVISPYAVTASDAQIMAGAIVQACATIGENTIVNTGARVDHGCRIGAHVHLAPGVTLSGDVHVEDETHVGAGATVLQGIRIGKCCTIAAGATVLSDVAPGTTVAGVPARKVRG